MGICDMELQGVKFPEKETFLGDLMAQQIVEKISTFHERLSRETNLGVAPFAESYFLNLMALYPVSMCSRIMTETLKLVAALFYFGSQSAQQKKKQAEAECKELFPCITPSPAYDGYTFEDLALIFDRSRTAIVEAVKQKRKIAKVMLEEAALRCEAKQTALERIAEEEKTKPEQKDI